jgi:hypothetical protein
MIRVGAVLLLAAAATAPHALVAQGVRGTATTHLRYLTLRPVSVDTVPRSEVTETAGGFSYQGEPVYCEGVERHCVRYVSADVAHGVVATQDISATAWGLGVQGLSATILVRGRADLDSDFVWPRSDDQFDAILAYAELQRSAYRVRAGRQRTLSGLGFSGFDGLDVLVSPWPWLRAELYGGRSLARGLAEPRNDALRGIEDFILDQDAALYGGFLELTPQVGTTVGVRYQREIWVDRVGLVSERAAVDVRSDLPGPLRAHGALDYDFAFERLGKGHVTLQARMPDDWGWVELTGRRYVPYFELSTIWGFFSPTEYHEAELEATLLRFRPLTVWASAGWRQYGDSEISVIGPSITDQSQRYAVGARWTDGPWSASGEYRLETGFGAFLSSGDLHVRWEPSDRYALTARTSAFQQIEQFRVGDDTVWGAGVGGEVALPWRLQLRGGADIYAHSAEGQTRFADFNQVRAYSMLTIPFGRDPGLGGGR